MPAKSQKGRSEWTRPGALLQCAGAVIFVGSLGCGPLEPPLRLAQAQPESPGAAHTPEGEPPVSRRQAVPAKARPEGRSERSTKSRAPARAKVKISDEVLRRAEGLQPLVQEAALRFELPPNLLNAIIWHESRFNPRARNPSGAKGLMQLMPKTSKAMAKRLERRNRPLDPEFSIQAGAQLLSILRERFGGSRRLMLFAYARGGGRVRAWKKQGGPMPERVRRYISKISEVERSFDALGFG